MCCLSHLDYTYNHNISSKEKNLISDILKTNTSYRKVKKIYIYTHVEWIWSLQVLFNPPPNAGECQGKGNCTEKSRAQLCSRWILSPEYHLHHRRLNRIYRLNCGMTTIFIFKRFYTQIQRRNIYFHYKRHWNEPTFPQPRCRNSWRKYRHFAQLSAKPQDVVKSVLRKTFYKSSCITHCTHGTLTIKTPTGITTVHIKNNLLRSIIDIPENATKDIITPCLLCPGNCCNTPEQCNTNFNSKQTSHPATCHTSYNSNTTFPYTVRWRLGIINDGGLSTHPTTLPPTATPSPAKTTPSAVVAPTE